MWILKKILGTSDEDMSEDEVKNFTKVLTSDERDFLNEFQDLSDVEDDLD